MSRELTSDGDERDFFALTEKLGYTVTIRWDVDPLFVGRGIAGLFKNLYWEVLLDHPERIRTGVRADTLVKAKALAIKEMLRLEEGT